MLLLLLLLSCTLSSESLRSYGLSARVRKVVEIVEYASESVLAEAPVVVEVKGAEKVATVSAEQAVSEPLRLYGLSARVRKVIKVGDEKASSTIAVIVETPVIVEVKGAEKVATVSAEQAVEPLRSYGLSARVKSEVIQVESENSINYSDGFVDAAPNEEEEEEEQVSPVVLPVSDPTDDEIILSLANKTRRELIVLASKAARKATSSLIAATSRLCDIYHHIWF